METEEESNSLMDELAAAWDAAEVSQEEEDVEVQQSAEAEPVEEEEPASGGGEASSVVQGEIEESTEVSEAVEGSGADTPPVGLSAQAREEWKDTPPAVRAEIAKREADYEAGIVKYAENAKRAEAMDRTLQPYQQLFAMNGGVSQTMPGLLQTAATLQMGAPQQKAQQIAALIKQFDVPIGALDQLLVGEQPQADPNLQVQALVDQRFQQMEEQRRQQEMQQTQRVVQSEIQQFASDPKNEFYQDVREDMADIMDMAARRNQPMTLQDAYQRAINMNPQISKIITARQSRQSVGSKRKAASSVHGLPGGPGGGVEGGSLRSTIEDAWEQAGRT